MVSRILLLSVMLVASLFAQQDSVIAPGRYQTDLMSYLQEHYTTSSTLGYTKARDTLYSRIDIHDGNLLSCVYSGFTISLDMTLDPSTDAYNKGVNCEHTWPQSMGADSEPQKSDMHHLFPCKSNVNSSRGNDPYAEIPDADTEKWYRFDSYQTSIPTENIDAYAEKENDSPQSFEPKEDHKGDAARAMFYFYTIYHEVADTNFWNVQKETLLQWHLADPVDEREYTRTNMIAAYQDNIPNPFVLDSSLPERLLRKPVALDPLASQITTQFELMENYPNPFNPSTNISYWVPEEAPVSLVVFDISGTEVQTLVNETKTGGKYKVRWNGSAQDGRQLGSGVYFARMQAGAYSQVIKMVYLP